MYKQLMPILQAIASWVIIIFVIIKIVKYRKEKIIKEQIRNLELQKYYEEKKKNKHYKMNKNIFTDAEKEFFLTLKQITDKMNLLIMSKVRLADIISTYDNNYKYFNKIKSKHIDFVIINTDGNFKLLIELDDKSHNQYDRIKRDNFINEIFENMNIKLLRIPVQYKYNNIELENQIKKAIV